MSIAELNETSNEIPMAQAVAIGSNSHQNIISPIVVGVSSYIAEKIPDEVQISTPTGRHPCIFGQDIAHYPCLLVNYGNGIEMIHVVGDAQITGE